MGAVQSISQKTLDDLKSVSEKLKSKEEVEELEKRVKTLIKDTQDKIDKQGDAKPATEPGAASATPSATPPATAPATPPATETTQNGGKRLKKRRISNKKRVSHRLTRSLKLI